MPSRCRCRPCPTPPKEGHGFCSWCSENLYAHKGDCHGNFVCFEPPCNGMKLWRVDYAMTHYLEMPHTDPYEDDERFLRREGLRRHPDRVSPLESFDGR